MRESLFNNLCKGFSDRIVEEVLKQLMAACENRENLETEDLELPCLPKCLGNMFQVAGRKFRRGMNDVDVQVLKEEPKSFLVSEKE